MDYDVSVSLVIPAYNTEQWIEECLESAINQTVPFDEIIIINDGSTDETLQICERYAERYNRIRLFSQENKGLSASRNLGISKAESEYIMFLDSDDCLELRALEILKENLDEELDGILFDAVVFGERNLIPKRDIYDRSKLIEQGQYSGQDYFEKYYLNGFQASACLVFYRKAEICREEMLFPDGLLYEDNVFSFRYIYGPRRIKYISEKLYRRRYRKNSIMTSKYGSHNMYSHIECARMIYSYLMNLPDERIGEKAIYYAMEWGSLILNRWKKYCVDAPASQKEMLEDSLLRTLELLFELVNRHLSFGDKDDIKIGKYQMYSVIKGLVGLCPTDGTLNRNYEEIKLWARLFFSSIFTTLGLCDESRRRVIYGVGKYAIGMVDTYEKIYGKFPKALYVDSFKAGTSFNGITVSTVDEVDDIDDIYVAVRGRESFRIKSELHKKFPKADIINLYELYPFNYFIFHEFFEF